MPPAHNNHAPGFVTAQHKRARCIVHRTLTWAHRVRAATRSSAPRLRSRSISRPRDITQKHTDALVATNVSPPRSLLSSTWSPPVTITLPPPPPPPRRLGQTWDGFTVEERRRSMPWALRFRARWAAGCFEKTSQETSPSASSRALRAKKTGSLRTPFPTTISNARRANTVRAPHFCGRTTRTTSIAIARKKTPRSRTCHTSAKRASWAFASASCTDINNPKLTEMRDACKAAQEDVKKKRLNWAIAWINAMINNIKTGEEFDDTLDAVSRRTMMRDDQQGSKATRGMQKQPISPMPSPQTPRRGRGGGDRHRRRSHRCHLRRLRRRETRSLFCRRGDDEQGYEAHERVQQDENGCC